MFFYIFFKNKIFRPGKVSSGQIFPFLLICIAALILGASIAISAGKSAITKTNVSNGADACSLAAGSVWASAFNNLVTQNKEMQDYYALSLAYYTYFYVLAGEYGEEGAVLAQLAKDKSDAALAQFYSGSDCTEWTQFYRGYELDYSDEELIFDPDNFDTSEFENQIDASRAAEMAAHFFNARYVVAFYMYKLTNNFKQSQLSSYCAARSSMDQAITQARSTGIQYAFSNSGTSSRAQNGDAFNAWLGSSQYEKSDSFSNPSSETNYNWQWQSKCGTSECGATVIVDMPKLTIYKLKHTVKNYPDEKTLNISSDILNLVTLNDGSTSVSEDPFNLQGYYELADIMLKMQGILADLGRLRAYVIWQTTTEHEYDESNPSLGAARRCCDATDPPCDAKTLYYDPLRESASDLRSDQSNASAALEAVLNDGGLSVKTLMADDTKTYDYVWNTAASGLFEDDFFEGEEASSVLCNDYDQVTGDSSTQEAFISFIEEMPLIIYIGEDPVFDGPPEAWQTKCSVTSYCSNIYSERSDSCSGSSATSTSTSEFHGEGVLKDLLDSYETQIIGVT